MDIHAADIPMPPHFPGSALLGLNIGVGQPTVVYWNCHAHVPGQQ